MTGAGAGIGRAVVERFLQEGARVVATDIRADRLEEVAQALGAPEALTTITGNVGDRADIARLLDGLMERHGRLDVVVNNAGIMDDFMPLAEMSDELRIHPSVFILPSSSFA